TCTRLKWLTSTADTTVLRIEPVRSDDLDFGGLAMHRRAREQLAADTLLALRQQCETDPALPVLLTLGHSYSQSVATSIFAIFLVCFYRSFQNWRTSNVQFQRMSVLEFSAIVTVLVSTSLVNIVPQFILEIGFSLFLLLNIYLAHLRRQVSLNVDNTKSSNINPLIAKMIIGVSAGLCAGLFGVGGGTAIVPLRMLCFEENVKIAIKKSMGLILLMSITALLGHIRQGNVLFFSGLVLGIGGTIGNRINTLHLPKLSQKKEEIISNSLLIILSIYLLVIAFKIF
ncbi:MAG: sulfite exporter TauE/SafE family protein, partial [Dolichospermum sp.]